MIQNGHSFLKTPLKTAKKAEDRRKADSITALIAKGPEARKLADSLAKKSMDSLTLAAKSDTSKAKKDSLALAAKKKDPKYEPDEMQVKVFYPKDITCRNYPTAKCKDYDDERQ